MPTVGMGQMMQYGLQNRQVSLQEQQEKRLSRAQQIAEYQALDEARKSQIKERIGFLGRGAATLLKTPPMQRAGTIQQLRGMAKQQGIDLSGVTDQQLLDDNFLRTQFDQIKGVAQLIETADKEQPFTLSPGSARYDAQGNIIAERPAAGKEDTGFTLSPGASRYDAAGNLIATAPDRAGGGGEAPSLVREYEYAKEHGYKGSFMDYQASSNKNELPSSVQEWEFYDKLSPKQKEDYLTMKRANRPLDVGSGYVTPSQVKPGTTTGPEIPMGLAPQRNIDPKEGIVTTAPAVPSGTAPSSAPPVTRDELPRTQSEIEAEQRQQEAKTEASVSGADTALTAIRGIKQIMEETKGDWIPAVGTASRPSSWLSSTAAGKVRAHVATLKSKVALSTMMRLKEASTTGATGFGQMNEKELQIIIDDMGALDPDNTDPPIFLQTVGRLEERYNRVIAQAQRTVPPAQLREWGLGHLIERSGSPAPGSRIRYDAQGNRIE